MGTEAMKAFVEDFKFQKKIAFVDETSISGILASREIRSCFCWKAMSTEVYETS